MKKILKWTGIGLIILVGIVVIVAIILYNRGESRLNKSYDIQVEAVTVGTDSMTVARGRHIAEAVSLCHACHGSNLEGQVIFDDPSIAGIYASNLTSGGGGVGARYTDEDYARAIRHGVNADGRGLMIMHSDAYHNLNAEDLGALVSYIRGLPPVDNEVPQVSIAALGKIFVALGLFDSEAMPLIPAEVIDHDAPPAPTFAKGETPEYGEYLVSIAVCRMCHGSNLQGGPPVEEGAPPGPNITIYNDHGGWKKEQFIETIRTGVTPDGRELNAEYMPFKFYGKMTDEELGAVWHYIDSVSGF